MATLERVVIRKKKKKKKRREIESGFYLFIGSVFKLGKDHDCPRRICTFLARSSFRPKIDGRWQFGADCDGFLNSGSILPKKKLEC